MTPFALFRPCGGPAAGVRRLAIFGLFVLAAAASGPRAGAAQASSARLSPHSPPVVPGEHWTYVRDPDALSAYGWDPATLRVLSDFVRDSANTTGLVVVDRGRVVFTFGDIEELSYVASVRKSILAILYGPWVENGTIDLDATLADLGMDDVGGLLPIERRATVHHLITARSGVYHPASNGGDNLADAPPRGSQEPGTYMLYNNWDFNAAGAVFEQLTGRNIYDELEARLALPLQFEDWDRSAQRKSGDLTRSRNPAYHMWLSTRDMARIGLLMLYDGRWGDTQIISPEWARRLHSVVTPLEEMNPPRRRDGYFGYGYMWWVWDGPRATGPFEGAYTARGAWGQWITVLPAVDLVVAHKTKSAYRRTTSWESWQRMLELILEARGIEVDAWPWR
ncbi:MAG: class C beta-lactamase-related serine hydrolase [Gemmatimonadetes bacterium]|nr:MAG: class C beta-lactamase-related serine hydrolase [Gemmatimonadota bacterium]